MTITFEAIYESGVIKPLKPITELKEKEKILVNVETGSVVDRLLANPIQIDPQIAREIAQVGMWDTTDEIECESTVDWQRRKRLVLEPEAIDDLMNNREQDLFEV